jgi:hypothetical protein
MDPYAELMEQNNIAPLDYNGGHTTPQNTYHYHAIPTIFFTCATGWDPTNHVWATEGPDGQHSVQIGTFIGDSLIRLFCYIVHDHITHYFTSLFSYENLFICDMNVTQAGRLTDCPYMDHFQRVAKSPLI